MKKSIMVVAVVSGLILSGQIMAADGRQGGGFVTSSSNVDEGQQNNKRMRKPVAPSTVEQAKTLHDDTRVHLKGYIIQSLGDEGYLFKDSTGTIVVEIDHDKWRGQTVSPTDEVAIFGEIDRDNGINKVDVKRIFKAKERPTKEK